MKENSDIVLAKELHKPVIKKFIKRRIFTTSIDDLWNADLIIMRKYSNENDGYNYMLVVIDTFSKFSWALPIKTKHGITVAKAFEEIIENAKLQNHKSPNLLHVDKGTEFRNKSFKEVLEKYNIKMYHTENKEKSAIIERFNRTLNQKMKIEFEINENKRWIDILDNLIYEYNFNDIHRSIKMKPSEVNKENEIIVFRNLFHIFEVDLKIKFKVGDRVRITKYKNTFHNKYDPNWTREIFTISQILQTNPVTYKIKDSNNEIIEGSFYTQELQKTKF